MSIDFNINCCSPELKEGISIFSGRFAFGLSGDGFKVQIESGAEGLDVNIDEKGARIRYGRKIHFFRALGLLLEKFKTGERVAISERPCFDSTGVVFDVSRNAVLNVSSVKRMIESMAAMGLDTLMLYTEDTYALEREPYFGYMRGRYTAGELREIDDYADLFGIEVVPCIQTLAHLEKYMQWEAASHLKDTDTVMLVGYDKTYELVDKMLKTVSGIFRSRKVHIGMDEAWGLGRGRYTDLNGYKSKQELMREHLGRVLAIARGYGLLPYMWGDMFFRSLSKTGDYYDPDAEVTGDVEEIRDGCVKPVYWDYYHADENSYISLIRKHRILGSTPAFAGGIWTWNGMGSNYGKTMVNSTSALNACVKEGVKEVFAAVWSDNGAEDSHFSALLGLQLYAEFNYTGRVDTERLKDRVKFCTDIAYDAFMDLKYLDEIPGIPVDNPHSANPSKYLLWQDLLLGLFDRHMEGVNAAKHYAMLEEIMRAHRIDSGAAGFIFDVPEKLCSVLKLKADMGIRITGYYREQNLNELAKIAWDDLPQLYGKVVQLRDAHRKQWIDTCKPFGWEVLDIRYGGLLNRIDTAAVRIKDFVEGRLPVIEELLEERLYFCKPNSPDVPQDINCDVYQLIATACPI